MVQIASGKYFREGISLVDIFRTFPDDDTVERWFTERRWPDGAVCCMFCGSTKNVQGGRVRT